MLEYYALRRQLLWETPVLEGLFHRLDAEFAARKKGAIGAFSSTAFTLLRTCCFEQKPDTFFSLVNPVLDKTGRRHVFHFVAEIV